MVVNVWVVYFMSPAIIVTLPNFVMEKYRPWLALVVTFRPVGKADKHRDLANVTGMINYFRFEFHPGYFLDPFVVESAQPPFLAQRPVYLCMRNQT